jgi:hypothetical protein
VIHTIEKESLAGYSTHMRSFALRLLALIAVLLLPLGMASAPAEAHSAAMIAGMPMPHCPDSSSKTKSNAGLIECSMACSSALPAADLAVVGFHPASRSVPRACLAPVLSSIDLEIATPPPRPS